MLFCTKNTIAILGYLISHNLKSSVYWLQNVQNSHTQKAEFYMFNTIAIITTSFTLEAAGEEKASTNC